jgi:tyrosyl-tRNA synthetase
MDDLLNEVMPIVVNALIALIPILLAIITRYLIQYLKAQLVIMKKSGSKEDVLLAQAISQMYVRAAEQISEIDTNTEKFNFVSHGIADFLVSNGIELTNKELEALIESSVLSMQAEVGRTGNLLIETGSTETLVSEPIIEQRGMFK